MPDTRYQIHTDESSLSRDTHEELERITYSNQKNFPVISNVISKVKSFFSFSASILYFTSVCNPKSHQIQSNYTVRLIKSSKLFTSAMIENDQNF